MGAAGAQIIRKMVSKTLKTKGNPSILKLKCQFFLACGAIIVSFINHKVSIVNSRPIFFLACGAIIVSFINHKVSIVNSRTVWPSDSYTVITKINSECSNHKVPW